MRAQFDNQMPLVTREGNLLLLCFCEKQVDGETTKYSYEAIRVPFPPKYGEVVSCIISDHYTADQMQAIVNNHLMDSESDEHKAEFEAMQSWRMKAKEIAREVLSLMQYGEPLNPSNKSDGDAAE